MKIPTIKFVNFISLYRGNILKGNKNLFRNFMIFLILVNFIIILFVLMFNLLTQGSLLTHYRVDIHSFYFTISFILPSLFQTVLWLLWVPRTSKSFRLTNKYLLKYGFIIRTEFERRFFSKCSMLKLSSHFSQVHTFNKYVNFRRVFLFFKYFI